MSDEFSWDDDSVVVESISAVAVYTNPKGNIVIRQQDEYGAFGEDAFIVIPRDKVKEVIAALSREVENEPSGVPKTLTASTSLV